MRIAFPQQFCSMFQRTLMVTLLTCIPGWVNSEIKPLQGKIISGVYYEETAKFVPYSKVVPLLFEFKLKPEYSKSQSAPPQRSSPNPFQLSLQTQFGPGNAFQILPRLNCRSDAEHHSLSTVDWYFTCPVMYHLNHFLQQYKNNITDIYQIPSLASSRVSLGAQENLKFFNSKMNFDECESVVEKMWKGISSRDNHVHAGFSFYTSIIEKCNSLPIYVEEKITDEGEDYSEYFDRMQSSFVSSFFLNSSDPGELVNNLLALQALQLQSITSEVARIREAELSCQNNMIPSSFVKYSRLEKALLDLRPKLLKQRYSMSIPAVSKLYKMPIADCILSGNSLIVQILLPVQKSENNYALLKVNTPTFLYENRLCKVQLGEAPGPLISDDEIPSKFYLYEKTNKMVAATECTPGDTSLCHVSDQASRPMINRCLTSVLNQSRSNSNDIRRHCHLQCEAEPLSPGFSKLIIPLIQRISSSKFVVAVNRITSLLVKCEGKPDEMVTPQDFGAVEISLACGCYLMWHAERFDARMPCANTVIIRHVVPEHMLNRTAESSRNKFYFVSNLGERINSSLVKGLGRGELIERINTEPTEVSTLATIDAVFYDSININETLLSDMSFNSLTLNNNTSESSVVTGYSYFKTSCHTATFTHTFLWIVVGVETTLFLGIALYLYCRIYEMNKKWDLIDRSSMTYSSAVQLNPIYE